jgi:hypothetical protein
VTPVRMSLLLKVTSKAALLSKSTEVPFVKTKGLESPGSPIQTKDILNQDTQNNNMSSIIDNVVGIACLPIGLLIFLNQLGLFHMPKIFGIEILFLGAMALVAIQASNLIATHILGHSIIVSYVVHILLLFPAILYFISKITVMPQQITVALPMMLSCFIIVEGLYSFFF